jgi:hypothetical protein
MTSTSWWPEITVDIVQSDLGSWSQNRDQTGDGEDDEEIECEWELIPSRTETIKSGFDKFDLVCVRLEEMKSQIETTRFNACMGLYHSLMAVSSDFAAYIGPISPLEYCKASVRLDNYPSESVNISSYSLAMKNFNTHCFDVTDLLLDHLVVFPPDNNHQDIKDIQRDSVVVNATLLSGSEKGYRGIIEYVDGFMSAGSKLSSRQVLSVANRTFSAGVAFDKVMTLFGCEGLVYIAPVSNQAEPIDIIVKNVSVLIRCHTRYAIVPESGSEEETKVDAFTMIELNQSEPVKSRSFVWLCKLQ